MQDYTPLHIAGIYGHAEIVEELLKNGDANPNDSNRVLLQHNPRTSL